MDATAPAQERIDEFVKRFGELRAALHVDIAALPVYIPNEKGSWELTIDMRPVDVANQPVKSPFA